MEMLNSSVCPIFSTISPNKFDYVDVSLFNIKVPMIMFFVCTIHNTSGVR